MFINMALCTETSHTTADMQISEAAGGVPAPGAEPCRFPKLEECAHFHYERVQLPKLTVTLQTNIDESLHSQHTNDDDNGEWYMVQATSGDKCWLLQRNLENFKMLDAQLHQCIYDRKISRLPDLSSHFINDEDLEIILKSYLERFSDIADNSLNCGPVLNWLQMDNKGHRLLVPNEESRSINTPAVAAAYSVRRYVSQARDELNLEVGDMISVIDMASPGESMWWRGKRGFQVGFFPQHCVHIIGDKVPRNMPLPPPVVGSLALSPIKPVLRKHGKLITFFRSFILNRPSRRRLKQSGILKERVFGCDLGEHLLNSGHDIPMVLKCCAEFIETHGIVDGIYRLSGVTSNIQKLRNAFDEDRIPNLYTEDILQDIHSVASLLKMYFRELPNPLCTYQLYQSFVNAVQGCNTGIRNSETDHERLLKMREAVQKLPPPHYRTLEYLMRHLAKVAKHGSSTGMTTRNVAIVWAPNLLRSAELEVGGVAALQGVGVQAVVTEFLICYAHLIFCDHLPNLDIPPRYQDNDDRLSPKKSSRPKSLAISTPAKLITLEEARTKHLLGRTEDCNYIEVGGGPKNLPKKYHTIIELPSGSRKRSHTKRSPLGWRSLFSKNRNANSTSSASQGNLSTSLKNRKASTPGGINISDKSVTESDLTDMKRKLRSVKSAESLTSGHSEPTNEIGDGLGPLYSLNKPPGHNRSVSHDSYFDTLQTSQNNSEGSLLDLSEIQLNFELEESEMRIFSEDESLVSSPRVQKDGQRRILTRARPEEFSSATNSGNPSPKKQARVVLSPDSMSRKRTRLEDQLSDIQYIDCTTPDNTTVVAVVHNAPEYDSDNVFETTYQPKNKSPRNSDNYHLDLEQQGKKRQSLNLDNDNKLTQQQQNITKSFTEIDIGRKYLGNSSMLATPTPQSPVYRQLGESSTNTTPDYSPSSEIVYQNLKDDKDRKSNYENILTTISITYKSPPRSIESSPIKHSNNIDSVYENVIVNVEKAVVPTSTASLPNQEAMQPPNLITKKDQNKTNDEEEQQQVSSPTSTTGTTTTDDFNLGIIEKNDRPKSLSALDDNLSCCGGNNDITTLKPNLSSGAICDTSTSEQITLNSYDNQISSSSNHSSITNVQYTPSIISSNYHLMGDEPCLSSSNDLSLSEIGGINDRNNGNNLNHNNNNNNNSSIDNLSTTSHTSLSFPLSFSKNSSPRVSPGSFSDGCCGTINDFTTTTTTNDCGLDTKNSSRNSLIDEDIDEKNVGAEVTSGVDLIEFSPSEPEMTASPCRSINNDKRKSSETESFDENAIYQQVKFFRRSIHEVNALLDLPVSSTQSQNNETEKEETSEKHVEEEKIVTEEMSEDVAAINNEEKVENITDNNPIERDDKNQEPNQQNYDSLESENVHVYENLSGEEMRESSIVYENIVTNLPDDKDEEETKNVYENVELNTDNNTDTNTTKICVKELTNRFEDQTSSTEQQIPKSSSSSVVDNNVVLRPKKGVIYDKDGLPPCLRARNLRNQLKTRSLDEEEFEKEFGHNNSSTGGRQRRQSFDDNIGYKTNSLPKKLNPPKHLPNEENFKLNSIHLAHSIENLNEEEQKKRERIEKYKEERRKFLHDKYRSESFKADKDALMSELKLFKHNKDETNLFINNNENSRPRRRSTSKSETPPTPPPPPLSSSSSVTTEEPVVEKCRIRSQDLKSRAAIFEQHQQQQQQTQLPNQRVFTSTTIDSNGSTSSSNNDNSISSRSNFRKSTDNLQQPKTKNVVQEYKTNFEKHGGQQDDFIRKKDTGDSPMDIGNYEKRRNTYDSRDRESETERFRRISLENSRSPRREKPAPTTYCIKDMKAIFESKSKQ